MQIARILGGCCGLLLGIYACYRGGSPPAQMPDLHALTVREESARIVFAWTGRIAEPMRDEFAAALSQFKADPRRILVVMNSPGGSLAHGREVMATIRDAAATREIDTEIAEGGVCASMCVPIYLLGEHRVAGPGAHFMFHEASLDMSKAKDGGLDVSLSPVLRKDIEQAATDGLFEHDYKATRVNTLWLAQLRTRISGADLWLSGRRLVEEGSGVIDELAAGAAN